MTFFALAPPIPRIEFAKPPAKFLNVSDKLLSEEVASLTFLSTSFGKT